ncbi:MAG: hypothetical protein AAGM22_03890 [Acidobacteriota bacterium]
MAEFLDIIFSLPTAVFTWPLMLVALYWTVALAGLFNFEWLDGADAALDSAAGALDGAIDGAVDGAVQGAAGGLTKLGDMLPEGSLESAPAGAESMPSALHHFGMGGVPRTYTGSLMILFGWIFSVLGSYHVPGFQELATRGLWVALLLAAGSLVLATAATAVAIQPLRKAMEAGQGPKRRDLIGQVCTITTQRVDQNFGQAELADGSSLIQVRQRDAAELSRGSKAVIFDYDADHEFFWVSPLELDP